MAFEAYLDSGRRQPRAGRRITFIVSLAAHGAAVLVAIAYSFWRVEEIAPPAVTVTFVAALAPPPAPPPPAAALGGGAPPPKRRPTITRPRPEVVPPLVQPERKPEPPPTPKEDPAPEPTDKPVSATAPTGPGTPDGVVGGAKQGGVAGGKVGGIAGGVGSAETKPAAPPPKFLPPDLGARQKVSGAEPDFPMFLRRAGANFLVVTRVCVGISGAVDSVTLMKRAEPTLDGNVVAAVKGWRFRPLTAGTTPVPFCYFANFAFKTD